MIAKVLFVLFFTLNSYAVCLPASIAVEKRCLSSMSSRDIKSCRENFGSTFKAYKTSRTCNLALQQEALFYYRDTVTIKSFWKKKFLKTVSLSCMGNKEFICRETCRGASYCEVPEGTCRDCTAKSGVIFKFYQSIGKSITSAGKLSGYALSNMLLEGNFISLSATSNYSILAGFAPEDLKSRFKSLCSDKTEYPVVFALAQSETRKLLSFSYVVCRSGVFKLSFD